MKCVYISIGSNLFNPLFYVKNSIKELRNIPETTQVALSSFYRSKPMGEIQDQPCFLNAVIALNTNLTVEVFFDYIQKIEQKFGRKRTLYRWGPRTLDLDIILYGNEIIKTKKLIIPHYGFKQREFVLYPLYEISPKLLFPDGERLSDRLKIVKKNNLTLWK